MSKQPVLTPFDQDLEQLSELLKRIPKGDRITPATRHRWVHRGVGGVKLPAIAVHDRWYSTPAAVSWFFAERTRRKFADGETAQAADDVTAEQLASVGL